MAKNSKYILNGAKSIFKIVDRFKLTVKISNKNTTTAPNVKTLEHRFRKLVENFKLPNGNNASNWLPRYDNHEKPLLSFLNRQSRKPGRTKKRHLQVSNAETRNNILLSTMAKNSKYFLNRITIRYTFKSEIIFKSHENTTAPNIKNLEPSGNTKNWLPRFHNHKKTLLEYLDRQSGRQINNEHSQNNILVSTIGTNFKYFLNGIRSNFKSHKNTTPPNIKNLEPCGKANTSMSRFDNHRQMLLSYLDRQSRKLKNTKNKLLEVNNEQTRNNLLISTMGKNSKFFLNDITSTFKSELIFKSHKNTTAPNIKNLETSSKANNWLPRFNNNKTLFSNLKIRHRYTGTGVKDPHLKRPPGALTVDQVGSVPIDKTLDWLFYKTIVIEGIQLCQALYSDHKTGTLNNIAEFAAGKTGQYFGGFHVLEGAQSDAHTSKALDWLCYKTIFVDGYQLAQAIYNDHKTGIMNNYAEWDIVMNDKSQNVGEFVDVAQGGAHIGKTLEWFCYITIVIDGIQLGHAIYKDHKNGTLNHTTDCAVDKTGQYVGGFVGAAVGKTFGSILMPGIGPLVGAFAVGYLGVTYGREIAPKTASYIQNYWTERKLKQKKENERIRIYISRPTSKHLVISFKKIH